MRRRPGLLPIVTLGSVLALTVSACGDRSGKTLDDPIFPLPATTLVATSVPAEQVTAPAPLVLVAPWVDGADIPARHTCDADGVSPPLSWSNVPLGTAELALSVVDLDAGQFVHWLVDGIGAGSTGTSEGVIPEGAFEWPNSSGDASWAAICPPAGETHRYQFTLYALNQQLEVADDADTTEVLAALDATSIARASLSGLATGTG